MKTKYVSTAYDKDQSFYYDSKRFFSPYGELFNQLELEQFYVAARRLKRASRVLEVGCGTGRFTEASLSNGHEVFAVEPSPYMLAITKNKLSAFKNNLKLIMSEGASIPLPDETFGFVVAIRVVNQLPSENYALEMVREMIRVCQPGGVILVEFVNKWSAARRSNCVKISVKDLEVLLESYPSVNLVNVGGLFFLPGSLLKKVPKFLLKYLGKIDRILARLWPQFCTRCYVTLEKDAV